MGLRSERLLTCGPGTAYIMSLFGKRIAAGFDSDTGIVAAFRVTWNSGRQLYQFPRFTTSIHDPGTFYFGTDVSVEILYSDAITYVANPDTGGSANIAPADVATMVATLSSGSFTVLITPLALSTMKALPGPLNLDMPLAGALPPLTCKYRAPSSPLKPSLYITHAMSLRAGDTFRDAVSGGSLYTTPGQPVAISDGVEFVTSADGAPGQIRWLYGT